LTLTAGVNQAAYIIRQTTFDFGKQVFAKVYRSDEFDRLYGKDTQKQPALRPLRRRIAIKAYHGAA
jgi:hypothetical protein